MECVKSGEKRLEAGRTPAFNKPGLEIWGNTFTLKSPSVLFVNYTENFSRGGTRERGTHEIN